MENINHCQICGSEVKSKFGIIAHHGYKRPDEAWHGNARQGYNPHSHLLDDSRLGEALQGEARIGSARQGSAR